MQTQQTPSTPASAPVLMAAPIPRRYLTIPETAANRPFTTAALRDLRFKAADRQNSRGEIIKGNGTAAAGVWISVGRKILVDIEAFDKWIESHKPLAASK